MYREDWFSVCSYVTMTIIKVACEQTVLWGCQGGKNERACSQAIIIKGAGKKNDDTLEIKDRWPGRLIFALTSTGQATDAKTSVSLLLLRSKVVIALINS